MLQSLLTDEQIASAPILILGNKIDLPGAASEDEIRHLFGLHSLTTGKVNSRPNFSVYLLWPPCIADADIIFLSCGFFFFLLFFLAYSQPWQIACLPYFHTWCGLSANLECMSEMCCMWLTEIQDAKKCHYWWSFGSDIAIFVLKRDVKLQLTNCWWNYWKKRNGHFWDALYMVCHNYRNP